MKLSEHFTLEEFIVTEHRNINNTPSKSIIEQLSYTARCLESVRNLLKDKPININSGYRCLELNTVIGGSKNSQHMLGQAIDFICPTFGSPDDIIKTIMKSNIKYDQLIREFDNWVHISFVLNSPRMQTLIIDNLGARKYGI